MPSRRQLLAAIGATPALAAAGCLDLAPRATGHEDGPTGDPTFTFPDDPDAYPVQSGDRPIEVTLPEGEPYESVEIGSRAGVDDRHRPHNLRIATRVDVSSVDVGVHDALTETTRHAGRHAIPEDDHLHITLLEPSKYLVTVRVPDVDAATTLRVPCGSFDCNWSATNVVVPETGEIGSSTVTTLIGCPEAFSC